jgi:hypothetical protein
MSDEKERGVIFTPKAEDDMGRIDEFPNIEELDSEDKIIAVTPKVDVRSVIPPEELENIKREIQAEVESEAEIEGKLMEDVDEEIDLNKKNYIKIGSTLYIKPVESDKTDDKGEKIQLYDVLNPTTETVERRELTDEEKREIQILRIKESRIRFKPIKHPVKNVVVKTEPTFFGRTRVLRSKGTQTNVTVNQFDADYRKKRQRKNKMQKASRRLAHKK